MSTGWLYGKLNSSLWSQCYPYTNIWVEYSVNKETSSGQKIDSFRGCSAISMLNIDHPNSSNYVWWGAIFLATDKQILKSVTGTYPFGLCINNYECSYWIFSEVILTAWKVSTILIFPCVKPQRLKLEVSSSSRIINTSSGYPSRFREFRWRQGSRNRNANSLFVIL